MIVDAVIEVVLKHARLPAGAQVTATTDLYAAGLTSLTTVHLMLALEERFEVEFPDRMLGRKTFETPQAIADAVEELQAGA